jgi:hypothetical protein
MKRLLLLTALLASLSFGATGVYETTDDALGTFVCDFTAADVCLIHQGPHVLTTPVLVGLPTNQLIHFVMDTSSLSTIHWPPNVHCPIADSWKLCGAVNGYNTAGGKYSTTFWSDGTAIWANGDTGNIQTVNAAHVNGSAIQAFNLTTLGPGTFQTILGTTIKVDGCTSIASPAVCGRAISGAVAMPIGAMTLIVDDVIIDNSVLVLLTFDSTLNTRLGIPACSTVGGFPKVSGRIVGTSFQISTDVAPLSAPACYSFFLLKN